MLKRLSHVALSASTYLPTRSGTTASFPQPIQAADQQRLVKLTDSQDKVNVFDWSAQNSSQPYAVCSQQANSRGHFLCSDIAHSNAPGSSASCTSRENSVTETAQLNQLQQHIQQQQRLGQVERKIRETLNFSTIVGTAVVETALLFNARQVNLLRYDGASQACKQAVRYCQDQKLAWQTAFTIKTEEFPGLLQQLWQGKTLQISPGRATAVSAEAITQSNTVDPNIDSAQAHEAQKWLSRWPGTWLLIPIEQTNADQANTDAAYAENSGPYSAGASDYWGFIALALPKRERWDDAAVAAANSIIATLTAAMRHAQQYHELAVANQELQKLALSDGLTCLANRRRFDEHLASEWQRLARDQKPLSLILCDLDHFKRYNDAFGHPAGDRCLIRVARALLNGPQRPADLVARYGGEEFAIILPNTDTHGAWRIAQKIHDSIRALRIRHAPTNQEPYVTVTMGVSTVIPGHDNTAQMLVQASDLALYHAKQHGRNRTYINGHYNTVSTEDGISSYSGSSDQLDVMPLEADG